MPNQIAKGTWELAAADLVLCVNSVGAVGQDEQSALHWAASNNSLEVADHELLLGAEVKGHIKNTSRIT